jgi:DNA-binding SARP family transcriptional activator
LANLLWDDVSTAQSKSYLRKTLWQLHGYLDHQQATAEKILRVDPEWIELNLTEKLALDVASFEAAATQCQGKAGCQLGEQEVQTLQSAVALYRGDLLEGWFQEWCLYERERFQHMYLVMLDKLMGYCEAHAAYETGILYGTRILRYDAVREYTHRQLMRLHYLAGDRTAALHQYERCVALLRKEMDVGPARQTVLLYEQICADQLHLSTDKPSTMPPTRPNEPTTPPVAAYSELLDHLRQAEATLQGIQHTLRQDIQQLETFLHRQ